MLKIATVGTLMIATAIITGRITAASAQEPADFYRGRVLNLLVGNAVGGRTDHYARLLARHLSPHIPGNPTIVVQNMPGASSGKLASYLTVQASRDGSVIGALDASVVLAPLLSEQALPFDPSTFSYLGSINSDVYFCIVRSDAPVKSFQEALSKPVIMGTTAAGSRAHDFAVMLDNVLGAKLRIVPGYPGTQELSLAIEKGEVQGMCGLSWSTLASQHPDWISRGVVRVLVQEDLHGRPELNKIGVPLAVSFAKTDEDRRVMELFYGQNLFGRPFAAPQGIPGDRLAVLRTAFLDTLKDKELLTDAARTDSDISPVSGDDVQSTITKLYNLPTNIIKTRATGCHIQTTTITPVRRAGIWYLLRGVLGQTSVNVSDSLAAR